MYVCMYVCACTLINKVQDTYSEQLRCEVMDER